jgi:uncharacterized protein
VALAYETPGVYFERPDSGPRGIAALRTDVAAFVGMAARGPLHTAVPLESWRQFQAWFGDFVGTGYLAYVVRAFFENGGRRCWVVRVASEAASAAFVTVPELTTGTPAWRLEASSPGVWGQALEVVLAETRRAQTRSIPARSGPEATAVQSAAGFVRGALVEISQGALVDYRVVADVDAAGGRLLWPEAAPLAGFAPAEPLRLESVSYSLEVYEDGVLSRLWEDLSLVPDHPRYGPRVLGPTPPPRPEFLARRPPGRPSPADRVDDNPDPITIVELRPAPAAPALRPLDLSPGRRLQARLVGGADGLSALSVRDFVGEMIDPRDGETAVRDKRRGLGALDPIDEVAIVAVPDVNIQPRDLPPVLLPPPCVPDPCLPPPPPGPPPAPPRPVGDLPPRFDDEHVFAVQAALVDHCERHRDRFALIDPPFSAVREPRLGTAAARVWRQRFESTYAGFYFPWIVVVDPLRVPDAADTPRPVLRPLPAGGRGALTLAIPPCGHVAGQFAASDLRVGVHKAPANVPLAWAQDVTLPVDDAAHGVLNPAGINVVRPLPGRGLRIYGARTVSSDPDWRFVNVRRLLMMIEKAVDHALQWAVFEPNDTFTRTKLTLVLDVFLRELWQQGALMGTTAEQAFYVRCDETNNPPAARDRGELLAEVGVAASVPFEFVVLRIGRSSAGFEISEADAPAGRGA